MEERRGRLITFEGIDGSGKTTQARLLAERLTEEGHAVTFLREPGGTVLGERIREILLDTAHDDMSPVAELFLYLAARAQITFAAIRPAIDRGGVVVMDRFMDSTTAYQGYARGLGFDLARELNAVATGGLLPDLTIVIDTPADIGLSRLGGEPDRLESEGLMFMERVRNGFLKLCDSEPGRVVRVDGDRPVGDVFEDVLRLVRRIPGWDRM